VLEKNIDPNKLKQDHYVRIQCVSEKKLISTKETDSSNKSSDSSDVFTTKFDDLIRKVKYFSFSNFLL
jgi:hypothetical protein